MKLKKHILLLVPGFPESDDDTTCIPALQAFVKELHDSYKNQVAVSIISFQYPHKKGNYTWFGIPCWSAGGKNFRLPRKLSTWLNVAFYFYKLHRRKSVDIIHSFWIQDCTLIGQWLASLNKIPHVAHIMGQDVLKSNPYIRFINFKKMVLIANSAFAAKLVNENFEINPAFIIPFGLQPNDFSKLAVDHERTIDLLNVGSMIPLKNQELFIQLFAELIQEFPLLKGKIIGRGYLKNQLQKMINELGLSDNLFLAGELSREKVLIEMTKSKILLHTSTFESAGYVFLEAIRCGMKVVSFQTGFAPPSESVFQVQNKSEMVKKLTQILTQQQEFLIAPVPLIADTVKSVVATYSNISPPHLIQ